MPHHASTIPLVFSTTTGLVSPQFHVVFDDKFTTVKCLHNNQLPSNWPFLFNNSATFYVDSDFTKTTFYNPNDFTDLSTPIPPAQRENTVDIVSPPTSSLELKQSSSIQREDLPIPSIYSTTTDSPTITHSLRPHTGWNPSHRYNTRFKQQHIANLAPIDTATQFTEDILTSYLASQETYPFDNNNALHALQHLVLTASNDKDTLHFWEMQQAADHSLFEQDMCREMTDLVHTFVWSLMRRYW